MVVGMRQTRRATQDGHCYLHAGVAAERVQRGDHDDEEDSEADQQDFKRDFIGCLLTLGALYHGDHVVEERLSRVGRDQYLYPTGEDSGTARNRAAVAFCFPYYRRGFACHRRFIHERDALQFRRPRGPGRRLR